MTGPHADGGVEGKFFDVRQRATIEAAMARIIPTDDQPGAREAETIEFLDRYISRLDFIYAKPEGRVFEKHKNPGRHGGPCDPERNGDGRAKGRRARAAADQRRDGA